MKRRRVAIVFLLALCGVGVVSAVLLGRFPIVATLRSALAAVEKPSPEDVAVQRSRIQPIELVADRPDTIRVPGDVVKTFGITTGSVQVPDRERSLVLAGALALDTNLLAHVHTRFAGEVVELGSVIDEKRGTYGSNPQTRPIRFGDHVEKGQLLAVLWSSDLGEKKSEYIDAISRLRMERETLTRQEALFRDEATPERNLREARRAVESAQIAVARVERTLRSWRLNDGEIADTRAEAEAMKSSEPRTDTERDKQKLWARVELRAPLSGTILEVNLAVGDIVATDVDLFKIADMSTLRVWTNVYEEDLSTLLSLPRPVSWTVRLKSDAQAPPIRGTIEMIGDLIDPNQHTALVVGQIGNADGRMRAGQFVTAEIEVPASAGEVEIPISALVEDGTESCLFVQPKDDEPVYAMRRVSVVRRGGRIAFLRKATAPARAAPASAPAPVDAGHPAPAIQGVEPGEHVVTSGAVELRAALAGLQEDARTQR